MVRHQIPGGGPRGAMQAGPLPDPRRSTPGNDERGVLAVGLTFPVVPRGDETIRFQINAAHTEADIDQVLGALEVLK